MKVTSNTIIVNDLTTIAEAALSLNREHMDYTIKMLGYVPHGAKVIINAGRTSGHTTAAREIYSCRPKTAAILRYPVSVKLFKEELPTGITRDHVYCLQRLHGLTTQNYKLVIIDQASSISKEQIDTIISTSARAHMQTQFLLLG